MLLLTSARLAIGGSDEVLEQILDRGEMPAWCALSKWHAATQTYTLGPDASC